MAKPQLTRLWRAGAVLALASALAFLVVAPPERCPTVSAGELRGSAHAAVDWFARNQEADGTWLYLYDADDDSTSADYNAVRHSGAIMALNQAAAAGLPGALESADRGTGWSLDRLIDRGDWSAVEYLGEVEVGTTALLAAGLAIRREATGDPAHDEVMRRMGRFLLAQTEPSGAVLASYDPDRRAPVPDEHSKYFTGEAYWALTLLHSAFPNEGWDEGADRIGEYLATSRDDAEGHWPPVPDHWAAYGLAETVEFPERGSPPLTPDEVEYARRQAELFGASVRWVSQSEGPWGSLVRGPGELRGGGYGVIGEALTGLWLTASAEPRLGGERDAIADRAMCIAGLSVRAQADAEDAAGAHRPEAVEGAWFRGGETRMDDQQHALSALLRTIPIAEAGGGDLTDDGDPAPAWVWAVVLLLALNPARAAFGVPRAGRTRRDSVWLAAIGGVIGGLAVIAAAAVGDPLLDGLDVSDASFRVAAGILAMLVGGFDLFRRPPEPEPALEGWRAALVPVAVPLVARPTLLILAVGAGADLGAPVALGAMLAGVAALGALTARGVAGGSSGRVLRWAVRLFAAALVAGGVALVIEGVLDV